MENVDCLFCKICAKEIPASVVYEDDYVVAFDDIEPEAPVHVLVVPKTHVASIDDDASNAQLIHLFDAVRAVAKKKGIAEKGYRVITNVGEDGGQSVHHLHLHVLGGKKLASHLEPAQ